MDAHGSLSVVSSTDRQRLDWDRMLGLFKNAITSGNEDQQLRATKALRSRCNMAPDSIIKQTIFILVRSIESASPAVQESIVDCFNVFSGLNNGSLCAYVGQSGGIAALLRLLKRKPPSEQKMIFAKCLTNLLESDRQNRVIFQRIRGLRAIMKLIPLSSEENKGSLLELLSAAFLLTDARRYWADYGGVGFLIQALSCGSMVSRARAAYEVGLMATSRAVSNLLVHSDATPPLMDLMRDGDEEAKHIAANSLGLISLYTDNVLLITRAGAIPLYAELLEEGNDHGKEIAADVLRIFSFVQECYIQIWSHLAGILCGKNDRAKLAALDVLWDTTDRENCISVLQETRAIFNLLNLSLEGGNFGERALEKLSDLSYTDKGREVIAYSGAISLLTHHLGSESRRRRIYAAEALYNFSEDTSFSDRTSHLHDDDRYEAALTEHFLEEIELEE